MFLVYYKVIVKLIGFLLLLVELCISSYIIFHSVFLIKKFDLKTPGREDDNKLTIFNKKKMDYSFDQSLLDPQVQMIIKGLGGRYNFSDLDCCITRLRASLQDPSLVSEGSLKQAGQLLFYYRAMLFKSSLGQKLLL